MAPAIAPSRMLPEQNQQIADAVGRERRRLWTFIRRRVLDEGEAEDILQDVLYELVIAYRQLQPLEEVGAWLFRVARNRITDLFRRKRPIASAGLDIESLAAGDASDSSADASLLAELLLPAAESPDALLARELLLERLAAAVERLAPEQRDVFIAHEIEGLSFSEMAARTGVPLNTLLARKHYAVKHLRRELQGVHDEWFQD
jgi:RNA polymerase sigma factor (sigma-70 family)